MYGIDSNLSGWSGLNVLAGGAQIKVSDDVAHSLIKSYATGIKDAESEWRSGRPILLGGENQASLMNRIAKVTDPIKDYHQSLGSALVGQITEMRAAGMSNQAVADYLRENIPGLMKNTPVSIHRDGRQAVTFTPEQYAELVSRTIPNYLRNEGYIDHIQALGVSDGWIWDASMDERTCDDCWENHGEEFSFDDPRPPEASHPYCRCRARANPKSEEDREEMDVEPEVSISAPPPITSEVDAELSFMSSVVSTDPYYPTDDPFAGMISVPGGMPLPVLNELSTGLASVQKTAQEMGLPLFRGIASIDEGIDVGRGILRVDGSQVTGIWKSSAKGQVDDLMVERKSVEAALRMADPEDVEDLLASLTRIDRAIATATDPAIIKWGPGMDVARRAASVLDYLPASARITGTMDRELAIHTLRYYGVRGNARLAANPPLVREVERLFAKSARIQVAENSVTATDWFADGFVLYRAGQTAKLDKDLFELLKYIARGGPLPVPNL